MVLDLATQYGGFYRCVTADNFFMSVELVKKLYILKLLANGTVRKNKPFIPPEFLLVKKEPVFSSIFAFSDFLSIVRYITKPNKCVILISSKHHRCEISEKDDKKPLMILDYNKNKGQLFKFNQLNEKLIFSILGQVDAIDQQVEKYSCRRKTTMWNLNVFMYLLDVASLNARIPPF